MTIGIAFLDAAHVHKTTSYSFILCKKQNYPSYTQLSLKYVEQTPNYCIYRS